MTITSVISSASNTPQFTDELMNCVIIGIIKDAIELRILEYPYSQSALNSSFIPQYKD